MVSSPSLTDKPAIFQMYNREKSQFSFYANKPVRYYTTFGNEGNQKTAMLL
jgi:hypothetical protein